MIQSTDTGGILRALNAAGYDAGDISHVVLTHMHGDHIGGMRGDSSKTFANAAYITGQKEYNHWVASGNESFDSNVKTVADKTSFIKGGDTIQSGITAVEMFGHTPRGIWAIWLNPKGNS